MGSKRLDIVFTAPHPDDLEIGCGGTIALLVQQGYRVGMVHLTNGEPTPRGSVEQRMVEARNAADVLGAQVLEVLPLTNRELMDVPTARYALATVLRKHRPRALVGIAGRTVAASPDHYQAQLITEAARFYAQLTKWNDRFEGTEPFRIDHLVYRPIPSSAEAHLFPAQFVVDISSTVERKLESIHCYQSQFDGERWTRLKHYVLSTAGAEGLRCGFAYGELYALPRPLGVKDMMSIMSPWEIPVSVDPPQT
ncbi:MAG TPA: PIG-L family deacetylase [Phycisphaerae bacterium]|nr:PIG-L family deacetylase [Phycisphaerae bacterium]HRY68805.1 PIG-L family deacetylase [Phycisphaerae bacterium]HSA27468.1 PIG-L family deacetylase [Phycisphaerae bacterium]